MTVQSLSSKLLSIAKRAYDKPHSKTLDDFRKDFAKLRYIKRIICKFKKTTKLNERLLVNHLILWFNTFNTKFAFEMLIEEVPLEDYDVLFPILSYLSYLPDNPEYNRIVWNEDMINKLNEL